MPRSAPAVTSRQTALRGLAQFAFLIIFCNAIGMLGAFVAAPALQRAQAETAAERAGRAIQSLKGLTPLADNLSDYVADPIAVQQLGKALFWDTQLSTDGTACASCHFHAGVDIRNRNQVAPGLKGADRVFDNREGAEGKTGPNKVLDAGDFPFHKLSDPSDRESAVTFDSNDIFASQGNLSGDFVSTGRAAGERSGPERSAFRDTCRQVYDPFDSTSNPGGSSFHANNLIYRRVEPRHTPTNINAVFNRRQFWDGRASSQFNGVDAFGARTYVRQFTDPSDPSKTFGNPRARGLGILVSSGRSDAVEIRQPLIDHSSLASQAVGTMLSDFEVACGNASFADIGRRLLTMKPLSTQVTDPTDSVFGLSPELVNSLPLAGLKTTYGALVAKAFKPAMWAVPGRYRVDGQSAVVVQDGARGYTQMEHNFALFFGLAIQAYEALLISDDAAFDRGPAAMSTAALRGAEIFKGKAGCAGCHNGPLFSSAAVTSADVKGDGVIDGRLMGDGYPALVDRGFVNTGVRPAREDPGVGAVDPYGFDLSFSRQYKWRLLTKGFRAPERFQVAPCSFAARIAPNCNDIREQSDPALAPRDAVDGAFKVPTLRNIGLTPPYFHNGGQANLKDVVRFYNRGGDRRGPVGRDTTATIGETMFGVRNTTNLDPRIASSPRGLGLSEDEIDDLVQFLLSLTDQRVACHSGVFDHPQLPLVIGHRDSGVSGTQRAKDIVVTLPAVGQAGMKTCLPNTGDFFGTLNVIDRRKLHDVFGQILR